MIGFAYLLMALQRGSSSPTVLMDRLSSPIESVRFEAWKKMGVAPTPNWPGPISRTSLLIGRYREDGDLAIVAIQTSQNVWSSVLLRSGNHGWRSIGNVNCWCKYESEPLSGFAEFRSILQQGKTDLLIHDSGGGSGVYGRTS